MELKKHYRNFSWFTLFFCVAVILWGAYVRATGSGAGCGSHWPTCNGQIFPRAERIQTVIEFSHRLSSGISFILVLALFIWTFKIFPKGFQRKAATYAMCAMILEASVGAMLVLLRHVEHNTSMDRVFSISLHLVNTLFLLAALTITASAPSEIDPRFLPKNNSDRKWLIGMYLGFALLGTLGAMAALGDTLFPVQSLAEGFRSDFDEKKHFLEKIRIFHPILAVLWYWALWHWVIRVWEKIPEMSRHGKFLLGLASLNLIFGLANVLLLAPIWMQATHLLVADAIWILFVSYGFSAASRWR